MAWYFNELAKKEIVRFTEKNYGEIEVYSGHCRFNFRCHNNAVHEAIENKEDRLAMCIYIDNGYPIIHFINVNGGGSFVDNTLGHWSSQYKYYLVRYIERGDFFKVIDIFSKFRITLRWKLRFFTQIFSNIKN